MRDLLVILSSNTLIFERNQDKELAKKGKGTKALKKVVLEQNKNSMKKLDKRKEGN